MRMQAMIKVHHALAFLALLVSHVSLLSQAQQTADDLAIALLAIKADVGTTSSNLTSWNSTSTGGPCDDKWHGVTCDSHKMIIRLNMSSIGLRGKLRADAFLKLTNLQSLDFSKNSLKGSLPTFDQLKALHDFNFSSNEFFGEPFPTSLLTLTNLVELRLDNNKLTGKIPEEISKLQLLEQLWLGNNTLLGPLPLGLASLTHLQTLTIWGSDLEQTLRPEWGAWVNLTYLNLHNAKLTGNLPPGWGQNFTKLEKLYLWSNALTGSIPDSWKGMTSLQEVRFKYNDLTGTVPAWFAQLQKTRNARVEFECNFLTGPYPTTLFNSTTWKGNCFDTDIREHDVRCSGDGSCAVGAFGESGKEKSFSTGAIAGIVVATILLLCAILFLVYWARAGSSKSRRRRRGGDQDNGDWQVPQGVRRLTYKEITKVTKSFDKSCEIGEGGFGKVYMAQLEDGKHVAIKRASELSFQGTKEFQNEITLLSRLHHRHLVRLEGFCDDRDEQILVYEYMSNGNLHRHLFDKHASNLNWYRRLEIALAVAQGLDYLHSFADPPVIHRDVKPSNILLDENMMAKVSDFGISKANPEMDTHVSTRPAGTAGYLDPEYFLRRQLTTASDVYGYGVVLLELITGQLAIDHKRLEDYNLVGWVKPKLVRKGIHAIIDPRLGPDFPVKAYEELAEIGVSCTAYERGDRPSMQAIASKLEDILSGLIPPFVHLMPSLFSPSLSPLIQGEDSNSQITAGGVTQALSDVKIEFDITVLPR